MDFEIMKEAQQRANISSRNLISLEQISSEYFINDIDDPMLYAIYKTINKDKLMKYEIETIDETIKALNQSQQKINDYSLSICVNEIIPY